MGISPTLKLSCESYYKDIDSKLIKEIMGGPIGSDNHCYIRN